MRQANALDFDDLLLESVRLLSHDAVLREQYNRRFEFVMIDEYQDTNRSQYELMRLLTQQRQNVCVVGDEDQSIYSWRGADIRNILDFERDYPNAQVIRLEQNYRSTKNILEAASAVVANNTERIGKWLWTEAGAGDNRRQGQQPFGHHEVTRFDEHRPIEPAGAVVVDRLQDGLPERQQLQVLLHDFDVVAGRVQRSERQTLAFLPVVAVVVVDADRRHSLAAEGLGDSLGEGRLPRGAVAGNGQHDGPNAAGVESGLLDGQRSVRHRRTYR